MVFSTCFLTASLPFAIVVVQHLLAMKSSDRRIPDAAIASPTDDSFPAIRHHGLSACAHVPETSGTDRTPLTVEFSAIEEAVANVERVGDALGGRATRRSGSLRT